MTRAVLQMVGVCALAMGVTMTAASACPGGGDKKAPPSLALCPGGGDKKTPAPAPAPSIVTTPDRDRAPV